MTLLETFIWGAGGSIAVEIVSIYQVFQTESAIPVRYSKFWFYVVRILMTAVAGGLAVGYEIDKPLLAANIGAATPLIIQALAQGVKPSVLDLPKTENS